MENKKDIIKIIVALVLFFMSLFILKDNEILQNICYLISYLLVGLEIILKAIKNISKGEIFDENFLMTVATIGAFLIGEYPEGVAVMLFYQIGELFQDYASDKSRDSITELMDIRPDYANLKQDDKVEKVNPATVKIDDIIVIKPGEKVPLDAVIVSGETMLDTSALTGEAIPKRAKVGDTILSGMINASGLIEAKVIKEFGASTVSKILDLVEHANEKKANSEQFITKFAKIYTPIVVLIAALLAIVPPLVLGHTFQEWIYRALVFLVISCPCALVISIPLSFFAGIGGAAKNGVLIKGANYLEVLAQTEIIVFDKTGTLTKGVFEVQEVKTEGDISEEELLELVAYAENYSSHPIAISIKKAYGKEIVESSINKIEEIAGYGINASVKGKQVLVGNKKLLENSCIATNAVQKIGTVIYVAVDGKYSGYLLISDEIKEDSKQAIELLKKQNIKKTVMLTGDKKEIGEYVGSKLGIDEVYAELLPDQKVEQLEKLIKYKNDKSKLAFVGDGINDSPVLARADIGIAMGAMGSDAAIEAADIVLMNDEPTKIVTALKISKKTLKIVKQNIAFAIGVKILVLLLGALGIATMWQAVFADVGVSVVAILNAMRALKI